jgi:hypothetical protein
MQITQNKLVFWNRVMEDKVMGNWRKLCNEKLGIEYRISDIISVILIRLRQITWSTHERGDKCNLQ